MGNELYFLGRVVSRDEDQYKIEVDSTNINNLPLQELSERIVVCSSPLEVGKIYYFYKATKEGKQVTIHGHTLLPILGPCSEEGQEPIEEYNQLTEEDIKNILNDIPPSGIWEKQY